MKKRPFLVFTLLWIVTTFGFSTNYKYKRVVSLAPSLTEMVYALGAQNRLVGVTRYCNYPPETSNKTRVGGMLDPNIETLIRLKPNLILLSYSGNTREQAERFAKLGFKTMSFKEKSLSDIVSNLVQLGKILKVSPTKATNDFITTLKSVQPIHPSMTAVLLLSWKPAYSVTANTFIGDAIRLTGLSNVVVSPIAYPSLSIENLVRLHPAVIIAVTALKSSQKSIAKTFARFNFNPKWIFIDTDSLSRPGPRVAPAILKLSKDVKSAFGMSTGK